MRALRPSRCPVCGNKVLKPVKHNQGERREASGFVCGEGHVFEPEPLALYQARRLCSESRALRAEMQEGLTKARARTERSRELRTKKLK